MTDVPQPGDPDGPDGRGTRRSFGIRSGLPGLDFSQLDLAQVMRLLQSEGPVNWEIAAAGRGLRRARRRDERAARRPPSDRDELDELAARRGEPRRRRDRARRACSGCSTQRDRPHASGSTCTSTSLRPVLEALAVTLRKALDEDDDEPDRAPGAPAARRATGNPFGHAGGRWRRRPVRRPADDARPAAARRAGGLDGRLPRAARARSLRPPAPDRRRARASRSSCRTSPRSRRRGRSTGATCASRSRCTRWCTRPSGRCRGCASGCCAWRSSTCPRTRSTRTRSRPSSASSTRATRRRSPGSPSTPRRCSARCSPTASTRSSARVQALTMVLEGYADVVVERLGGRLAHRLRPHPRGDAAPPRRAGRGRALHRAAARPAARPRALRAGRAVLPGRDRAGRASTA